MIAPFLVVRQPLQSADSECSEAILHRLGTLACGRKRRWLRQCSGMTPEWLDASGIR